MSFVAGGITEPSGGATAKTGAMSWVPKTGGAACCCPNKLPPGGPDGPTGLAPNVVGANVPKLPRAGAPKTGAAGAGLLPNVPSPTGAGVLPNSPTGGAPENSHGDSISITIGRERNTSSSRRELTKCTRCR
jgi:hypothetical protein